MFRFLRAHPIATLLALILHLLLVYIAIYGVLHHTQAVNDVLAEISDTDLVQADMLDTQTAQATTQQPKPEPVIEPPLPAQPTAEAITQQQAELVKQEQEKREQQEAEKKRQEQEEKQRQQEAQRLAEQEKQAAEARRAAAEQAAQKAKEQQEKALKEQQQKALEKQKQAELLKQIEDAKKKQAAEEERKKLEAQKRLEEEKKKQEVLKKQQQEAELKKKAEQEAKAQAEAQKRKQELLEQAKREEAMRKAMQAERDAEAKAANAAMVKQETATWVSAIAAKVKRAWIRESDESAVCDVYMKQTREGVVKEVRVKSCQGDASESYKRSVELAVRRASPLPKAPSDEVFREEIIFIFKPQ